MILLQIIDFFSYNFFKTCKKCGVECAIAKKKCICGVIFEKRSKTAEDMMPKYTTNITHQRRKMECAVNFSCCKIH